LFTSHLINAAGSTSGTNKSTFRSLNFQKYIHTNHTTSTTIEHEKFQNSLKKFNIDNWDTCHHDKGYTGSFNIRQINYCAEKFIV